MAVAQFNYNLPWQGLATGGQALSGLGGDPKAAMANLGPLYQSQYAAALGMNQALHQGVQTGYDSLRQSVDDIYGNIYKNYDSLYGDVLGRIAGTNTSNIRDIEANARAQSAASQQSLINRGLGNTTILNSANRGINSDRQREITRSNEQFAQLGAGYANQIGQNRIGAQQSKAQMMAGLGTQQLGALERVNAGYPDAGMYGQLAQMYGASAEADKNRQQLQRGMAQVPMASGGYSYSPSPWGSRSLGGGGGGSWGGDSWTGNNQGSNYGSFYQPQQMAQRPMPAAYSQDVGGYSDLGTDYYTPDYGGVEGMDQVPMDNYGDYGYA